MSADWAAPTGPAKPSLRREVELALAAEQGVEATVGWTQANYDEINRRVSAALGVERKTTATFDHSASLALNIPNRKD